MHNRKVWSLHMMVFGVVLSERAWNDECAGYPDLAYMYCMLTINISYVELLLTDSRSSKDNTFPTQKRMIRISLWQYYCPQVQSLSRQWDEQINLRVLQILTEPTNAQFEYYVCILCIPNRLWHSAVATDLGHPYWICIIPTHGMHHWLLLQFLVLLMMDAESVRNM
jgi:hypothetical protein